MKDKTYIVHES